jgi:hypothetical protein
MLNIESFLIVGKYINDNSIIIYSYLYTKLLNLYYTIKKYH